MRPGALVMLWLNAGLAILLQYDGYRPVGAGAAPAATGHGAPAGGGPRSAAPASDDGHGRAHN